MELFFGKKGKELNIGNLGSNPFPFTQSPIYQQWQENFGRKTINVAAKDEKGKTVLSSLFVKYPLIGKYSYLYSPYGPLVSDFSEKTISFFARKIANVAKKENAVFVRLDFTPKPKKEEDKILKKFFSKPPKYSYTSSFFQPRKEWVLKISESEEKIMAKMKPKGRYSIRLAGRKGVKAKIIDSEFEKHFPAFYEIFKETAERNNFKLHPRKYYQNIFRSLKKDFAYLSVAEADKEILSAELIILYNKTANYVYGGSRNKKRNLMPTYLSHWQAILEAKRRDCLYYNFGGISEGEKWQGITVFKKKFGGEEINHSDFYDIVLNKLIYRAYISRKLIKLIKDKVWQK